MRRDDCRAHDDVGPFLDVHAGKAVILSIQNSPVDFVESKRKRIHLDTLVLGLGFIQPDVRDFRIRIGCPGDNERIRVGVPQSKGMREQSVLNDDLGHGVRGVSEFKRKADVSGRIDVGIGRLQSIVHLHAGPGIILHSGRFESESLHVGGASHADQYLIDREFMRLAMAVVMQDFLVSA